jgi:mannose-1-phosphate guanylyltransferase
MYVVILAGGGGTRLWPLSTPERPKPFLPLLGERTLFQHTVDRIRPLVGNGDIFCVVDRRYGHLVQRQDPSVRLIVEPAPKNTAAAIALAVTTIERPPDEVMVVLPADGWIEDEDVFRDVVVDAERELASGAFGIEDPLVTLGVEVDRPATEYGYLLPDVFAAQGPSFGTQHRLTAYRLRAFEEKPTEARAVQLTNEPGVAWNAGMFLWRRRAIRAALEKYTPLMFLIDQAVSSELALTNVYERIASMSIDSAVMESAAADGHVVMGAMDVGWSDLGTWSALLGAMGVPDIDARVVQPGDTIELGPDDLVVQREDGRIGARSGAEGPMTAHTTMAVLRQAVPHASLVEGLLARCS